LIQSAIAQIQMLSKISSLDQGNQYEVGQFPHRRILRVNNVLTIVPVSAPTLWRWVNKCKTFPAPISLGGRSIGWLESDVYAWINERAATRNHKSALENQGAQS
jgi:prophage regulatory protein